MRILLLAICLLWPSLASAAIWQCQANLRGGAPDIWLNYSLTQYQTGHFSALGEVIGPKRTLPFVWEGRWIDDGTKIAMVGLSIISGKRSNELKAYSTTREADVMIFQLVDEARLAERQKINRRLAEKFKERHAADANPRRAIPAPQPDLVRCLLIAPESPDE